MLGFAPMVKQNAPAAHRAARPFAIAALAAAALAAALAGCGVKGPLQPPPKAADAGKDGRAQDAAKGGTAASPAPAERKP